MNFFSYIFFLINTLQMNYFLFSLQRTYHNFKFKYTITAICVIAFVTCNVFAQETEINYTALREKIIKLSKADKQSELFNAISTAVMPSVVVVRTTRRVEMKPQTKSDAKGKQWKFYRFKIGQGSGVIVNAKKGYVLTNYHVVADAERLEIILHDGRTLRGYWMRGDKPTDLAIIKIPAENLIATPMGDSSTLKVGHQVLAFGAPMGLAQTVTSGIVSAKSRQTAIAGSGYQDFIQTDTAINRGNSGGPLANTRGEIVGINSMILSATGMNAGVGLAIPSNMVKDIMNQLIEKGKVERGYIGLQVQDISSRLALNMGLHDNHGALVCNIIKNSPADKAGLELEDFIVTVNGRDIRNTNQIRNIIAACKPGQTIKLEIIRGGKRQHVEVTLTKLKSKTPQTKQSKRPIDVKRQVGLLSLTLDQNLAEKNKYPPDTQGILITDVAFGSEAFDARLEKGMVITHINGKKVTSNQQLTTAIRMNMGKGLRLTVINPGGGRWLVLLPLEVIRINGGLQ